MLIGKVALITGSTSGIGLSCAIGLAQSGCNIVLNGIASKDDVNQISEKLEKDHKIKVMYDPCDLRKPDQITQMFANSISKFGSVDILINNAGRQHIAKIEEFPDEIFEEIMDVNLKSAFYTTKNAIPIMKKQNWGRIINIASVHGLVASVIKAPYIMSQHGIIGLTKATGLELAQTGITCNAICPGWVMTDLIKTQIEQKAKDNNVSFERAQYDLLFEKQPSLQFVTREQLSDTVKFLCSEAASEIRGSNITMDGGWTAQ